MIDARNIQFRVVDDVNELSQWLKNMPAARIWDIKPSSDKMGVTTYTIFYLMDPDVIALEEEVRVKMRNFNEGSGCSFLDNSGNHGPC